MKLLGLPSAALFTLVALTTAKPLPSAPETRSIVPQFDVTFGYWERVELGVGNPSLGFGRATKSVVNADCSPTNSIEHMNHITDLVIKDDEFCLFYSMEDCKTGGDLSNMFKSGPSANLRGSLKFEPKSVFCYSPKQSSAKARSLEDAELEDTTLEARTLDARMPTPYVKVGLCARSQKNGELECWEGKLRNSMCYNREYLPFLNHTTTLTLDKGNMCIFSDNDSCGTKDGHFSLFDHTSADLGRDGMNIFPKSIFCFDPTIVPGVEPLSNEVNPKRSLAIPETKDIQPRDSDKLGSTNVTFCYRNKPHQGECTYIIGLENGCHNYREPDLNWLPYITAIRDVDVFSYCDFYTLENCDPGTTGNGFLNVQGPREDVSEQLNRLGFHPESVSCWKPF